MSESDFDEIVNVVAASMSTESWEVRTCSFASFVPGLHAWMSG